MAVVDGGGKMGKMCVTITYVNYCKGVEEWLNALNVEYRKCHAIRQHEQGYIYSVDDGFKFRNPFLALDPFSYSVYNGAGEWIGLWENAYVKVLSNGTTFVSRTRRGFSKDLKKIKPKKVYLLKPYWVATGAILGPSSKPPV